MGVQRVALDDILPNPYRHIERYRINESKIEALIQSYDNSGFWDGSLQARPHPTEAGKYQLAFGHHRIEAARRKRYATVGLMVADRSDADMLRMMADENREEFKGDPRVATETIAATIEAFGRGEIELEAVDPKTNAGHIYHAAPHWAAYTCATIARFLGWVRKHGTADPQPSNACRVAFDAYHEQANVAPVLVELPERELSRQATSAVVRAVKSARTIARRANKSAAEGDAAAKRAAKEAVNRLKQGDLASKVKNEATEIGRSAAQVERSPDQLLSFVHQQVYWLRQHVENLALQADSRLEEIWPYRNQLDETAEQLVRQCIEDADKRLRDLFTRWIARVERR